MQVKNVGRRFAHGCVAYAILAGSNEEVGLHWADSDIGFETIGRASVVSIPPRIPRRLDVAFSSDSRRGAWLATEAALHRYEGKALREGQNQVKIHVRCDDGNIAKGRIRIEFMDKTSKPHGCLRLDYYVR